MNRKQAQLNQSGTAVIAGIGTALPPSVSQDDIWMGYFAGRYAAGSVALARRIFANAGVRTRQAAVSPLVEDVSEWSTERRMRRYQAEAIPLGKEAVGRALTAAGLAADEVGLFAVCSCTGYATPGLDILLARDMGMAPGVQRLFVGHMGCYAALPGLGAVADFVVARGRPGLLLCAELTSLHIQPESARVDVQQMVSHALFSDAAVAMVLTPASATGSPVPGSPVPGSPATVLRGSPERVARPGYAVREVAAVTDASTADHMTWEVTDLGFRMGLSPRVPQVLALHVRGLVDDLLGRHGLTRDDVDDWAVHPGGPRILDVVQEELELSPEALATSRDTLATRGNCSSPTVLLVLDALWRRPVPPRRTVMLAFGPGLTLYAALLERV